MRSVRQNRAGAHAAARMLKSSSISAVTACRNKETIKQQEGAHIEAGTRSVLTMKLTFAISILAGKSALELRVFVFVGAKLGAKLTSRAARIHQSASAPAASGIIAFDEIYFAEL